MVLDVGHDTSIDGNLLVFGANHMLKVRDGSNINRFTVDSDNGNTEMVVLVWVALTVHGAVDFNDAFDVDGAVTLNSTRRG